MRVTKEIPLTNGMVALVDDEDYDRLARYRWYPRKGRRGAFYAFRMEYIPRQHPDGEASAICRQMQRDVLDPDMTLPRHIISDHINHETLDNRKSNLRLVDNRTSVLNRRTFLSNKIGYRGVTFHKGRYHARIRSLGRLYYGGGHDSAEFAAAAYNALALQHHGEHAQLNVGPDGLPFPPVLPPHRKRGRKRIGDAAA